MGTAGRVAGWTFAGVLLGQLAFVLISRLSTSGAAAAAAEGDATRGRAVYDNAYLLFFLPHSLVAVSLVTAVFTRMAVAASAGRTDDVRADASLAVRLTGVATVVATAAVVVLGPDLARAVFFRNTAAETESIALVTTAMTLGLVAFSAMYMFQRVYYAYEDARTPFWIQVAVVTVWTAGSLVSAAVLPPEWVTPGIGLSMSVANVVGVLLAAALLRRRIGGVDGARVLAQHARLLVAAVVAGAVGWAAARGVHAVAGTGTGQAYLSLLVAGGLLLGTYVLVVRALRVPELDLVTGPLLRRLHR
jgi:putative peptidoglycan lipid II flippase